MWPTRFSGRRVGRVGLLALDRRADVRQLLEHRVLRHLLDVLLRVAGLRRVLVLQLLRRGASGRRPCRGRRVRLLLRVRRRRGASCPWSASRGRGGGLMLVLLAQAMHVDERAGGRPRRRRGSVAGSGRRVRRPARAPPGTSGAGPAEAAVAAPRRGLAWPCCSPARLRSSDATVTPRASSERRRSPRPRSGARRAPRGCSTWTVACRPSRVVAQADLDAAEVRRVQDQAGVGGVARARELDEVVHAARRRGRAARARAP